MKKGFTLAEVLITLSVLGVIAAVTIPSIISNFKKLQIEVNLKKTYALLENVINMSKVENGGSQNMFEKASSNLGYRNRTGTNYFVNNYVLPYLNYSMKCDASVSYSNCNVFKNNPGKYYITTLDGRNINSGDYNLDSRYRVKLKNGTNIAFMLHNAATFTILVDVNGDRGPNRFGYDTFYFTLNKSGAGNCTFSNGQFSGSNCQKGDRIYATLREWESSESSVGCSGAGTNCAAPIKRNGWKIPDNYPVKWF